MSEKGMVVAMLCRVIQEQTSNTKTTPLKKFHQQRSYSPIAYIAFPKKFVVYTVLFFFKKCGSKIAGSAIDPGVFHLSLARLI